MSNLPPNWTVAIDPSSGRTYYANPATGESSWQFPGHPPHKHGIPPSLPPTSIRCPPRSACPPGLTASQRLIPPKRQPENPNTSTPPPTSVQPALQSASPSEPLANRFVPQNGEPENSKTESTSSNVAPISEKASKGFLVGAAQALMDAKAINPEDQIDLELHSLTPGQIADLHGMQQEQRSAKEDSVFEPYVPINTFSLRELPTAAPPEVGRLDIRIHSLYDKLKKIPR